MIKANTLVVIVFVLVACFIATVLTKRVYKCSTCPPGDRVCKDSYMKKEVCYNSETHACVRDSKIGKKKLCGKGEGSCNGVCYNKKYYQCKSICKEGELKPILSKCGKLKCGREDSCCKDLSTGFRCFSTSTHDCVKDSFYSKRKLCGKGEGSCKGICFDKTMYFCKKGKIELRGNKCGKLKCSKGESCCKDMNTGYRCFNKNTHKCTTDVLKKKKVLCPSGHYKSCNGGCFNSLMYKCGNSGISLKKHN